MPDISTYFTPSNHIFISGVGGVSTSALASLLRLRGITVSGSDARESATTDRLRSEGVTVHIGHSASNIAGATCLIRSAAIHDDNPEIVAARAANIPVYERADAWGAIMTEHRHAICIAGTHGKTTTTGFAAQIALAAGLDPTITVGGSLPGVGTHRVGSHEIIIAESCEYCNSFLRFRPTTAVVLNIEADHLDFFSGIDEIKDSFEKFCRLVPPTGRIVLNLDDPNTREIMSRLTDHPIRAAAGAQSAPATAGAPDTATPPQHPEAPQDSTPAATPAAPATTLAPCASGGAPTIVTFSATDPAADVFASNITHTRGRYSFDLVLNPTALRSPDGACAQGAHNIAGAPDTAAPPQHPEAPQDSTPAPTSAAPATALAQSASGGAPTIVTFSATDPAADIHAANITHTRGRYSFDLVLNPTALRSPDGACAQSAHNIAGAPDTATSDTSPGLPSGGKDADDGIFSGRSVAVNPASRIDHGLDSTSSPRISVPVTLSVVGKHNVTDALAAAASLCDIVEPATIAAALSNARGVARRFEYKGEYNGADIYDDYAHHPSEIEALFTAARAALGDTNGKLLAIFHPHTYTRTKALRSDFAAVLAKADAACLLPIYAAREDPDPEISSELLAADINEIARQRSTASASPTPPLFCTVADTFESAADWARAHISPGDILLTVGAGEAYRAADILFI